MQHTVDAVANGERPFKRLNVNVTRTFVDRLEDDLIDKLDDTGLLRHLQQILVIVLRAGEGEVLTAGHFLNRVATDAVVLLDDLVDLITRGKHGAHLQPG